MAYRYDLRKTDIKEIDIDLFKSAIYLCYRGGVTSIAPLGFSGDDIVLYGSSVEGKGISLITIRNYGGDAELLITDTNGRFLFYGRYAIDMGLDFVAQQYFEIFNNCKEKMLDKLDRVDFKDVPINPECGYTSGFDILNLYLSSKQPTP